MSTGSAPRRSVVIHAHFYQPPREEPWLELVEREPSAAPHHDWNQRIERECYHAVVAARVPAADGRIARVLNTLEQISFNVGPTLAEWLEREAPETWRAILDADRVSRQRLAGHGNAIAMPYHHVILPLASRRDKVTEVRWGIADFRRRFGREAEGMWLPETAVDDETLDVLAAEGIRFTILAPHQVVRPPAHGLPGQYTTSNGREIAVFLYDGPLSHEVAFGPLITDAARWGGEIGARPLPADGAGLVSMATDGETYGHHHRFGEMALAALLSGLSGDPDVRIENYASFLARHPPAEPVKLVAPTSWSCVHGVERWRADCGCRMEAGTSQSWRAPLRGALDWLAGELHRRFEHEAAEYLPDPWRARDAYATVGLPSHLPVRARELLEMERNALRMFTSCGWFFDDVGGIETVVCLRYAARAIELAGPDGAALEAGLRIRLALAPSNHAEVGSGQEVYDATARPVLPGPVRAAAGYAALLAAAPEQVRPQVGTYLVGPSESGGLVVRHRRTGATTAVTATVERAGRYQLSVELKVEGEARGYLVKFAELPEREREEIVHAIRRELRTGVLNDEDRRHILEGTIPSRRVTADALIRLLPENPVEPGGVELERITLALDLLTVEEQPVPFDAQTRFYRLLTQGPPEVRRVLLDLAERFGFSRAAAEDAVGA